MHIDNAKKEPRFVTEYEYRFASGSKYLVEIDHAAGDKVSEPVPGQIHISQPERVSPLNPEITLPEKHIRIFTQTLEAETKSNRLIHDLTPEQREEIRKGLASFGKRSPLSRSRVP